MKCEAVSVKCEESVRLTLHCIGGERAGHVLRKQLYNSLAQSTHARAWLAHGIANSIDETSLLDSYSISLRLRRPASCGHYWYIVQHPTIVYHEAFHAQWTTKVKWPRGETLAT